jgi:hypothetical protein
VKSAARWTDRDLAGLRAWQESTPGGGRAILACRVREALSLGGDLWAVPLGTLLR